ncbi:MAG: stage II sporulation protein M, partial [Nanoarchaeota archaeon]
LFSFFFGAGAIFILAWNAALIAVALGSFIHDALATTPNAGLWYILGTVSYAFFGYMAHSIFEISAYFIAALAGGIISVAVIKHDLFHKNFQRIVQDALWLVALSLILLAVGAWVETGMSPIIFQ